MKKTMVVSPDQMPDWLEKVAKLFKEIFQQLWRGLLEPGKGLTLEQVQMFVEHRNPFVKVVAWIIDVYENIRRDWEKFYKDNLNLTTDFSGVRIPKCPGPGWRLIIVAHGLMPELVFQISMEIFGKAWKYYDASLDDVITRNERSNKDGAYAIWVRDGQEADEVHKNKSANQVASEKLTTETCLERLIHGLKYFRETRKHLDAKTITLCSGSRYYDGYVPNVGWDDIYDRLDVRRYDPDYADDYLRAREVVS